MKRLIKAYREMMESFGEKEFSFREAEAKLGLKRGSTRNLLSELTRKGWLIPKSHSHDKRRKLYKLNFDIAEEVAVEAPELRLIKDYRGEYVVFVRGKIVDHDEDLQKLAKRIIGKYPLDSVYITNISTPRRGLIIEV